MTWHVGDVIRKLREQTGESQTALGVRSRTSRPTIQRIEVSGTDYSMRTLEKIANALGYRSADALLRLVPPALSDEVRDLAELLERLRALDPAAYEHFRLALGAAHGAAVQRSTQYRAVSPGAPETAVDTPPAAPRRRPTS